MIAYPVVPDSSQNKEDEMTITKGDIRLTDLELWRVHGGPKHESQWVDGRSAKELARAWLNSAATGMLPSEVVATLASNPAFGPVLEWRAEPEVKLPFDTFRGEPRNSDLLVHARDRDGDFVIAVEGKADEPFGETVGDALSAALERQLSTGGRSMGIKRIEQLAAALFSQQRKGEVALGDLRYQLLTATAGALCAAREGVARVVLLIHEFVTDKTTDEKHLNNANDLDRFLGRLSQGSITSIRDREVVGPMPLSGKPLLDRQVDLYIGKAVRSLR